MTSAKRTNRHSILYLFCRFDSILARLESGLLTLILGTMIILAFSQVLLRNIFHSGILWGDTLVRQLVLWVGFIGASLATKDNRHINIDALRRALPLSWQRYATVLTNIFSLLICILLSRAALVFVSDEYSAHTLIVPGIPSWVFTSIIFIGFVIMTFRFMLNTILFTDTSKKMTEGT